MSMVVCGVWRFYGFIVWADTRVFLVFWEIVRPSYREEVLCRNSLAILSFLCT